MAASKPRPRRTPVASKGICGAKKKRGGLCKRPAGEATGHPGRGPCYLHGGTLPAVEISVARTLALEELRGFGTPVDIDPHEAMLLCIRIVAGEVQMATEHVNQLEAHDLIVVHTEEHDRPLNEGRDGENPSLVITERRRLRQELNVWIRVRHESMDRLTRYAAAALRAGLEERLVQVAEVQGKMLAEAVKGILKELGVAEDPRAPAITRKWLTQIAQKSTC